MEIVDPAFATKVALACFGRVYCGLSYDEAETVAEKAIANAPDSATVADLLETFDLVWGATLAAGLINPGDWNTPVHPLSMQEQIAAGHLSDSFAMYHANDRKKPKEYNDPAFVAKKPRKKKRKAL